MISGNRFWLLLLLLASPFGFSLTPGDKAPALELPQLESGSSLSLASLEGKVVYLDFWASWCGPCRISLPAMEKIHQQYAEQGFEVLAINVDEFITDAREFLEDNPVSYKVVRDAEGKSPELYQIKGMPTAFLVDRNGVIRHIHEGFSKGDASRVETLVRELLQD